MQAEVAIVAAAAVIGGHFHSTLSEVLNLSQAVAPLEQLWLQREHSEWGQRGQGCQQGGEAQ